MQTKDVDNRISPGYALFRSAWGKLVPNKPCIAEQEYFDTWEMPIEPEPATLTPGELLEVFPEAIATIKANLRALQEEEDALLTAHDDKIATLASKPENEQKIYAWIYDRLYLLESGALLQRKKRLEHLLRIDEYKRKPPDAREITDVDIAKAKQVKIVSLLTEKPSVTGFIRCPFHGERTASCRIFKDNRFHCFGCGEDGDAIDYVMKTENLDFLKAVRFLLKR